MKRTSTSRKPPLVTQTTDRPASRPNQSSNDSTEELIPGGAPVDPFQLVESAQASLLVGKEREGLEMLARAHQSFLSLGETRAAARCAFWRGFVAMLGGDVAQANGWLSRAERLLTDDSECVERGYLFLPVGYRLVHGNEPVKAYDAFAQAGTIGRQFRDSDLVALALQGQGRSLIRQGEITRGVALLDEAMVAVTAGEVKMRRAIAHAREPGMTAKGDGFAVLVPAIGVSTIAVFEVDQRLQARCDSDAAQFDGFGLFLRRQRPSGYRRAARSFRAWDLLPA